MSILLLHNLHFVVSDPSSSVFRHFNEKLVVLLQFCGECIREWLEKSGKEAKRREREREGKERKDSGDGGEEKGTCPHCRAEVTGSVA